LRKKKKYTFVKVIGWVVGILLLNIIALILLLHIPLIQTKLAQSLSRNLSAKTKFEISVDKVAIKWVDRATLKGLRVVDENGAELLKLDDLEINYNLAALFKDDIKLDYVGLKGLNFTLQKHQNDTLNISVLINRFKALNEPDSTKKAFGLYIDQLDIRNSNFYYLLGADSLGPKRFNPKNFELLSIEANLRALQVKGDSFKVSANRLSATEGKTGTQISKFKTDYFISPNQMRFNSLSATLEKSIINGTLIFAYDGYNSLSEFISKVEIEADIAETTVFSKELSLFTSYFDKIKDRYTLSGRFRGEISDFRIRNLDLEFGQGSILRGSTYISGIPIIDETFMDLSFKNSILAENDLAQYIPSEAFTKYNRFDRVRMNGAFTGYIEDFVAYGEFNTNLGTIISDINLKIGNPSRDSKYSGKIKLRDFNLAGYTDNSNLGLISLDGSIDGKGFTQSDADLRFDGKISKIDLNNYRYSGVVLDGAFKKEYFSGRLIVEDPNLQLHTINEIDLRDGSQHVVVNGVLEYANPAELNLLSNMILLQTKIEANINGFTMDSLTGFIHLSDLHVQNSEHDLTIEDLTINSNIDEMERELELISEKANIRVWGDFTYNKVFEDISQLTTEFKFNLLNNADSLAEFYQANEADLNPESYYINLDGEFGNIDNFIKLFVPDLRLHDYSKIDASFRSGQTKAVAIYFENDTITFNEHRFENNILNLDASKIVGERKFLAAADIQSANQVLSNGSIMSDLLVSAVWADKNIDFNWYNTQPLLENINDLYGTVTFYNDSTEIHFNRSQLTLLNEDWTIQDNNLITINRTTAKIENLNIGSKDQMVTIRGAISKDPNDKLGITANNLSISMLNPLLPKKLYGRLSGEFAISNIFETPTIVSNFYINQLYLNQFLVGDIYSSNDWSNDNKLFEVQFVVSRSGNPIILVNGTFNPFVKENALDMSASFMNARINMVEPFVETIFSNLKGNINGKIKIQGSLNSPVLAGNGTINRAGFKVNYLNTYYDVTGTWGLDSTSISLDNVIIRDKNNSTGTLEGKFTHQNFKDFRIDLRGTMRDFLVLNTNARQNELFYGTGIASGTLALQGPIEDITIRAKATTERGTRFFIPIGGSSSSEFEDYISFVDFSDTLNTININNEDEVKVTGLNLEFDLDITEDAYSEIIFDITSGDIIRGRGSGNLSMKIDTKGEFSLLGTYEFASGGYNFTMYNIVNKEFEIKPKSKITWNGDPYAGIMDIDASYKVVTSLAPLVDTVYQSMPDMKRNYPTEVLLSLKGPLLTPDITFDILIDEYPKSNVDLDTQIKGFLNTIAVDQQELNRQVFSLLILRKFSSPNSFSSSGTIGSSVSEFVSNQLSYWVSQVDDNLSIDMEVDLSKLDEDALKTFQLRVSYEFLDGKLIVTRDGGFTNPDNEADLQSIAGDWTLEYLLSSDGKLRVKLFNKTNYNQLNSATGSASQALISAGFSLIYTTSFDNFGDLFKRKDKKSNKGVKNTESSSNALKPEETDALIPNK
jgi:acetolactate synthase small subunit